jgi:uncharacterized membrane protein
MSVILPLLEIFKWVFGAYVVLLWMATVIWTYRDIHARHEETLATSLSRICGFVGAICGISHLHDAATTADHC